MKDLANSLREEFKNDVVHAPGLIREVIRALTNYDSLLEKVDKLQEYVDTLNPEDENQVSFMIEQIQNL